MILQRYIFARLAVTFFFLVVVTTAVVLLGLTFQVFRSLEGIGLMFLIRNLPILMGYVMTYTLLISAGGAATLVYARLSSQNELIAVRSSGIPMTKCLMPGILLAVLLCGTAYWLNNTVMPDAHYHKRIVTRLSLMDIIRTPPPTSGSFEFANYIISYDRHDGGTFYSMMVTVIGEKGIAQKIHARKGYVDFSTEPPNLVLSDCQIKMFRHHAGEMGSHDDDPTVDDSTVEELALSLDLGNIFNFVKTHKDMSNEEIFEALSEGRVPTEQRNSMWTDYYARYAHSLAPFFLVILCMSVGIMVNKESKMAGLGASLPPILIYFLLALLGEGMGESGSMPPFLGAFLGDIVLAAAAGALLWIITRR